MAPPARLRFEATSPMMATAPSLLISFCTAVTASFTSERSSAVTSLIFRPSTPPALFAWSMANSRPLCELVPKEAVPPVIEANSPMTISPVEEEAPTSFLQPIPAAQRVRANAAAWINRIQTPTVRRWAICSPMAAAGPGGAECNRYVASCQCLTVVSVCRYQGASCADGYGHFGRSPPVFQSAWSARIVRKIRLIPRLIQHHQQQIFHLASSARMQQTNAFLTPTPVLRYSAEPDSSTFDPALRSTSEPASSSNRRVTKPLPKIDWDYFPR